jgi:hypothetical protein
MRRRARASFRSTLTSTPTAQRVTDELPRATWQALVGEFDHALPAHALTEHRKEFFAEVQKSTIERFKALFALLNATVE